MASPHEQGVIAADATTPVDHVFAYRVSLLLVWSPDDEFHLGFDEDAVDTTIAFSQNIVYSIPIGHKTLSVLLESEVAGNVNVIGIYFSEAVHDEQIQENRGGEQISPIPTYF